MNRWWTLKEPMSHSREIQYESSSIRSTFGVFISFKDIRRLHRCFTSGRVIYTLRNWIESKLGARESSQFEFATPVHGGILYTKLPLGIESVPIVWDLYDAASRNPIGRMRKK